MLHVQISVVCATLQSRWDAHDLHAAQMNASLSEVILSTSGTKYCDGAVPALFPTCGYKQVLRMLSLASGT